MNANAILAAALNLSEAEVDATTALATTEAWDSLAHFRLVLAIEEKLGRKLSPTEIVMLTDQPAVSQILANG